MMFTGIRGVMKSMRKYEETGCRWGIWFNKDWALLRWANTAQLLPFLVFSSGILLPFLTVPALVPFDFSWTSWGDLLLSFPLFNAGSQWICDSCKQEGTIRVGRPPSLLLGSRTANLEICIWDLYCTSQTLPRSGGITAIIFYMRCLSVVTEPFFQCFWALAGVLLGRQDVLSNRNKLWGPGIACDYAQSTVQFVIMNLVKKPQKRSQGRYRQENIIFKNYASGMWGRLAVWECFWKVERSRLPNSPKYPGVCSSVPFQIVSNGKDWIR